MHTRFEGAQTTCWFTACSVLSRNRKRHVIPYHYEGPCQKEVTCNTCAQAPSSSDSVNRISCSTRHPSQIRNDIRDSFPLPRTQGFSISADAYDS